MQALEQMAVQMRATLSDVQKGYLHRSLFGGLQIVLERNGDTWRLAIARTGAAPSKVEAETVGKAFGLPVGVEWQWCEREHKKSARSRSGTSVRTWKIRYHVAECRWREGER